MFLEIAKLLLNEAKLQHKKISCAESCTGGLIAATLTEIPGSSEVFNGSAVVYSNQAKNKILGVSNEILNNFGAVSEECALAMCEGALKIYDSDFAVSVTGIAGPDGGTDLKPVGTVWFGFASHEKKFAIKKLFSGNRREIREATVEFALNELLHTIKL